MCAHCHLSPTIILNGCHLEGFYTSALECPKCNAELSKCHELCKLAFYRLSAASKMCAQLPCKSVFKNDVPVVLHSKQLSTYSNATYCASVSPCVLYVWLYMLPV